MEANTPKNCYYNIICVVFLMLTTFEIQAQILAEADCPDAYTICDATSQSYYFEVNGPGAIDDALIYIWVSEKGIEYKKFQKSMRLKKN